VRALATRSEDHSAPDSLMPLIRTATNHKLAWMALTTLVLVFEAFLLSTFARHVASYLPRAL
jgi:hypothetical protein